MLTKEIKQKDYLKNTKALRLRNYIGLGWIVCTIIIAVPAYALFTKKASLKNDYQKEEDEVQRQKIQQMFELRSMMLEKSSRPEANPEQNSS